MGLQWLTRYWNLEEPGVMLPPGESDQEAFDGSA
jgi:hypothetical protein